MHEKTHEVKVNLPTLESVREIITVAHYSMPGHDTYVIPAEIAKEVGQILWDYESLQLSLRKALEEKA